MIKAMTEANIPIDIIGGTSIGSFMGGLWAEESNFDKFRERAREWSMVNKYNSLNVSKLVKRFQISQTFSFKSMFHACTRLKSQVDA